MSTKFENFLIREIQIAEDKKFEFSGLEIQRVGGGSRIPVFRDSISKVFNRESFANINGNSYLAEGALLFHYLKENYSLVEKTFNQYVIELTQIESGETIEAVLFEKETHYGSYREFQLHSANYSKVVCFEVGEFIKQKVMEIDQEDIYETSITFYINEEGRLKARNEEISIKYFGGEEDMEKMVQIEQRFLQNAKDEEKLDKLRYELESKLIRMKTLQSSPFLTTQEKNNLSTLAQEQNKWSQANLQSDTQVQDFMERIKYIDAHTTSLGQREAKLKKAQAWYHKNHKHMRDFLNNFESQYAEKLVSCDEAVAL